MSQLELGAITGSQCQEWDNACEDVMTGFGFILEWLKKDVARNSPNSNNIMFRIKVLRIIILFTKYEYSRCSNKFSANTISNV